MQVNPYLIFNGQCEEAFLFYHKVLGGKIETMMTHEGSPMAEHTPPELAKKIMHASLWVGDTMLMGSDAPLKDYKGMHGFSVALALEDPAEAEKIFKALAEGGTVQMPIQETFWAAKFGMLTDRFGVAWMVNCGSKA